MKEQNILNPSTAIYYNVHVQKLTNTDQYRHLSQSYLSTLDSL